jgi:hypothetical protein
MKLLISVLWGAAVISPDAIIPTDNFGTPFATAVPGPVREYVISRQACDHFGSEPTGDAERDAFLAREVKRHCTGLEQRQRSLLKRYGRNEAIARVIRGEDQ